MSFCMAPVFPCTPVSLWWLGVAVNVSAVTHHIRTVQELRRGTWGPGKISGVAVTLAVLLALLGIGMGIYLLIVS